MSALGTKSAHHLRPHGRAPAISHARGTKANRQLRPHARRIPATPPPYLADYAHYPVRLNGKACDCYAGTMGLDGPPWSYTPQTINDAHGRRYWHPHSLCLAWAVGAGTRTLTATARHTFASGAYPRVRLPARPDLGLAEQTIEADGTTDTDQPLLLEINPTAAATVYVFLENPNPAYGPYTTWGNIETT